MHSVNGQSPNGKKSPPVMNENAFINGLGWKQEEADQAPEEESYQDKFRKSILDQTKHYPLPEAIVSIVQNGQVHPFLTLMSFSLWQGKQKSKKTTVLAMTVAAFLRGGFYIDGDEVQIIGSKPGKVIFFDNEQGESYGARTMRLILRLAELEETPNLVYCDLRKYLPEERKKIIIAGIEFTPGVKLVVIDGLVDLMQDFMDAGEGHLTVTDIIRLCSTHNIHIAGVLHQNKADANARAHVGSIASQKCEIEVSTEVDKNDRTRSVVKCVNSRWMPFEDFAIQWENTKGALPKICQDWTIEGKIQTESLVDHVHLSRKEIAEAVFKPLAALTYTQAVSDIMEAERVGKDTAKRRINEFIKFEFISKGDDGLYRKIIS